MSGFDFSSPLAKRLLQLVNDRLVLRNIGQLRERKDLLYPERDGASSKWTDLNEAGSDADFIEMSLESLAHLLADAYEMGVDDMHEGGLG